MGAVPASEGWHCFVAFAGDEPAAAGALFAEGSVGWLGAAATRPAFRRRGGQRAVVAARIERARELGLTTLVVETEAPTEDCAAGSHRNIVRAGFREEYIRPNWLSPR